MGTFAHQTSPAYQLVRKAIQEKLIVVAEYKGHVREMCPHVIGTKDGRENALFYQFAGGSSSGIGTSGATYNWRCIHLNELSNIRLKKGEWHTAGNHSSSQTCVDNIDVEVEY